MRSTQDYLELYQKLHDGEIGYIDNGIVKQPNKNLFTGANFTSKLLTFFDEFVTQTPGSFRILDYGCGKAKHVKSLYQKYEDKIQTYYCYDPGYKLFERAPDENQKFDILICADVMEHIPKEQILPTLRKMSNHLDDDGIALFTISGNAAKKCFLDGENLHITLYSFYEWVDFLKEAFPNKRLRMIYEESGINSSYYTLNCLNGFARNSKTTITILGQNE